MEETLQCKSVNNCFWCILHHAYVTHGAVVYHKLVTYWGGQVFLNLFLCCQTGQIILTLHLIIQGPLCCVPVILLGKLTALCNIKLFLRLTLFCVNKECGKHQNNVFACASLDASWLLWPVCRCRPCLVSWRHKRQKHLINLSQKTGNRI